MERIDAILTLSSFSDRYCYDCSASQFYKNLCKDKTCPIHASCYHVRAILARALVEAFAVDHHGIDIHSYVTCFGRENAVATKVGPARCAT